MTIPGTGVKRGERLPSGARIVYRDVTLEGKQTVGRVVLRAPAGKTIRGLAVARRRPGRLRRDRRAATTSGRKQVASRAYVNRKASGEHTGRLYGLVR